jgi:hypothetical protein
MSDHKWDRFKRVFGVSCSDELITARDNKVRAALDQVTTAISRLVEAGLDAADLTRRRDRVDQDRQDALGLRANDKKSQALDRAKQNARALAEEATATADRALETLAGELQDRRDTIDAKVKEANDLRQPLCRSAAALAVRTVQTAVDHAEHQITDEARRAELEQIDLAPLTALLKDAKAVDSAANARPRLVFGWPAPREKLLCGEPGLNDVVVELLKMAIMREAAGVRVGDGLALRLVRGDAETLTLDITNDETEERVGTTEVPRSLYDDIHGDVAASAPLRDQLIGHAFVDTNRLMIGE